LSDISAPAAHISDKIAGGLRKMTVNVSGGTRERRATEFWRCVK